MSGNLGLDDERPSRTKVCDMEGVREYGERATVELWRGETGRLVLRAYNECGNNYTEIDLWDVMDWLSLGPRGGILLADGRGNASRRGDERD